MILIDEITWTMKDRSSVEPFLNETWPNRTKVKGMFGLYYVDGGTVYVTGRMVIFKERS